MDMLFFLQDAGVGAPAAGQPQSGAGPGMSMMIPLVLMFVVMYFLMIRPQNKERKKRERNGEHVYTRYSGTPHRWFGKGDEVSIKRNRVTAFGFLVGMCLLPFSLALGIYFFVASVCYLACLEYDQMAEKAELDAIRDVRARQRYIAGQLQKEWQDEQS